MTTSVAGTGGLVRLILRRDRYLLPLWVVLLGALPALYASATEELYPTDTARHGYYASVAANPSLLSMVGPVFGSSLGALTAWRSGAVTVFLAVAAMLTVIRHTRAEEDAGRRELLVATVCGRQAPLVAALTVTFAGSLALGAVVAAGLIGYGLPTSGSIGLGLSYAAGGWVFAALGAVAAQLTEGAGAARGIALSGLGAAFLLRAVGDAAGDSGGLAWLSWASPLGWVLRLRPFAGEQWWVLSLLVALCAVLTWVALALQARRDMGAGVLRPRLGAPEAGRMLRGPVGLAWRLHRGALFGWSAGFALMGLMVGGAAQSVDRLVADSAQLAAVIGRLGGVGGLTDAYLAASVGLLTLVAGAYAAQAALRARAEEAALRAEPVLATAVGRGRWLIGHVVFAVVGPAVALAVFGVSAGLVAAHGGNGPGAQALRMLGAALVQLPAVSVVAGVAVAVFGLVPRAAAAVTWGVFAWFVFVAVAGALLEWDRRLLDLSPFSHVAKLPVESVEVAPLAWLGAVAVGLLAAGLAGFGRRDIA